MIRTLKREIRTIGANEAKRFIQFNNLEGQRALSNRHVEELSNENQTDLFLCGNVVLAYKSLEPDPYLINGQHQLRMVINTEKPIEITYEEYRVDTKQDLADLYSRYDSHRMRGLSTFVSQEKKGLNLPWPQKFSNMIVNAASQKEFGSTNTGQKFKAPLLRKYIDFGEFAASIMCSSNYQMTKTAMHLHRNPVVYAILETYNISRTDSYVFWMNVRDGENLTRTCPEMHLRNFLLTHSVNTGAGSRKSNPVYPHEVKYRSIMAWNAYRQKKPMKVLKYYADQPVPRAL